MNRHERRKLEALGSGVYKGKHRGSKPGFNKGSFGSPGIDIPKRQTKAQTGRGNIDYEQLDKLKELLRKTTRGITAKQAADYCNVSQARAARLLDLLSGTSDENKFLVYSDEETDPTLYFMYRDDKNGGEK